jgi:hypothetical protein
MLDIHKLHKNFYEYCWDPEIDDRYTSPMDVLIGQEILAELYSDHIQRITNADLSYPIIITDDYNVRDGMHRLCKYYKLGINEIKCVIITRDELNSIMTDD